MMRPLHANALALVLAAGLAHAGITDETGAMGPGPVAGAGGPGAAVGSLNAPMRTSVSLNAIQKAFDQSDPRANVANFVYKANEIYKLRMREFMSTTVVLPKGENIAGWFLVDKKNFTFTPQGGKKGPGDKPDPAGLDNIFTVHAEYPGADTNLTVFGGSGRVYPFYLRVDSVTSSEMPVFVAYLRDPGEPLTRTDAASAAAGTKEEATPAVTPIETGKPPKMTGEEAAAAAEYLRSLPGVDPAKINLNAYRVAGGDKDLEPVMIFDDGYWTYFKLSNDGNLDRVKAFSIYRVVDGYDTPANTRVEGGTLIAEGLSKGWTLRRGEAHLCVRAK